MLALGSVYPSAGFDGIRGADDSALAQDEQIDPDFPSWLVLFKCWAPFQTTPDYYLAALQVRAGWIYQNPSVHVETLVDNGWHDVAPTSGEQGMPSNPYAGTGNWLWWGSESWSMWFGRATVTYTNTETGEREIRLFQFVCPVKPANTETPLLLDWEVELF